MGDPISTGIIVGAGISAGAELGSAAAGAGAAGDAQDIQWLMYQQARADLSPWKETGEKALGELSRRVHAGPGKYTASPYYGFLQKEGVKALDTSAAARGALRSGAHQKALTQFGQNLASTDYDSWLNRYYQSLQPFQNLSVQGQNAAAQQASQALQTGQNVGNLQMAAGQAKMDALTNIGNLGRGVAQDFMFYDYLKNKSSYDLSQLEPYQILSEMYTGSP